MFKCDQCDAGYVGYTARQLYISTNTGAQDICRRIALQGDTWTKSERLN